MTTISSNEKSHKKPKNGLFKITISVLALAVIICAASTWLVNRSHSKTDGTTNKSNTSKTNNNDDDRNILKSETNSKIVRLPDDFPSDKVAMYINAKLLNVYTSKDNGNVSYQVIQGTNDSKNKVMDFYTKAFNDNTEWKIKSMDKHDESAEIEASNDKADIGFDMIVTNSSKQGDYKNVLSTKITVSKDD